MTQENEQLVTLSVKAAEFRSLKPIESSCYEVTLTFLGASVQNRLKTPLRVTGFLLSFRGGEVLRKDKDCFEVRLESEVQVQSGETTGPTNVPFPLRTNPLKEEQLEQLKVKGSAANVLHAQQATLCARGTYISVGDKELDLKDMNPCCIF